MTRLALSFLAVLFTIAPNTDAWACQSRFDAATGTAVLSCVEASGTDRAYDVVLQASGSNIFVVTGSSEYVVSEPSVSALRLVLTPRPVAVVFGNYSSGCVSALGRPIVTHVGQNTDIALKARSLTGVACTLALKPFAEAIDLSSVPNPAGRTYTVNGVPVVPMF
jgi:hypothetical protein